MAAANRTMMTFALYLRVCSILAPLFLVFTAVGLFFLTEYIVSEAVAEFSTRVGNSSARVATGLENISELFAASGGRPLDQAAEILQVLMSDPAVVCLQVIDDLSGSVILEQPNGHGCSAETFDLQTTLPIYFPGDAELRVFLSDAEVDAARQHQVWLSVMILIAGLMITLVTNWITFRVTIGKPLSELVIEMDQARRRAKMGGMQDGMTGLPNRQYFEEMLDLRCRAAATGSDTMAVMLIEIANLGDLEMALGNNAGHAMLRHIAEVLHSQTRNDDVFARIGVSRFGVILSADGGEEAVDTIARRLMRAIERPVEIESGTCAAQVQIGTAIHEPGPERLSKPPDKFFADAEMALYHASGRGPGERSYYSENLRETVETSMQFVNELTAAIDGDEVRVSYRLRKNAVTGQFDEVEARARWRHPFLGPIAPRRYLHRLEHRMLLAKIDALLLSTVAADLAIWAADGVAIRCATVFLSDSWLRDTHLISTIRGLEVQPGRMLIAVTEQVAALAMDDVASWNLDEMRERGIGMEIVEYSGNSISFPMLWHLTPRRLMLAKSALSVTDDGFEAHSEISSLIAAGEALNLEIGAGGLDTEALELAAMEAACAVLAGEQICALMSADDITSKLRNAQHTRNGDAAEPSG